MAGVYTRQVTLSWVKRARRSERSKLEIRPNRQFDGLRQPLLLDALNQKRRNVASTLGHCHDPNPLVPYEIENQVCAYRPKEDRKGRKVSSLMTHSRSPGQRFKRIE